MTTNPARPALPRSHVLTVPVDVDPTVLPDKGGVIYPMDTSRMHTVGFWVEHGATLRPNRHLVTVDDVPAGQGTASLVIGPDPISGETVVLFKEHDGTLTFIDEYPSEALASVSAPARAWREYLAATLPTITNTAEEAQQ